jgi:DNA replication protein DnaC
MEMDKDKDAKETLASYLKELHLPAFRTSYEELARQARQEGLSYEQFLLTLAQRECQQRRNKRVERRLTDSRLPLEKSLAALDLKRLPPKVVQQVRTLLEGSFLDRHENGKCCSGSARCWCRNYWRPSAT